MAEYREFQDGELIAGTRYQVLRLIGVGGMGTVYEVEHVELGKRFVLKALLRELSRREDLVIRLRNEWRALGRLEHPNIVTVTDAGTSASGVPFYVMERLEGETLSQRMRRTRRFPVREAVDIAAGVLEGLAAAHQIGVVHRDVKPPNIFLVGEGRPKVLDFGVAKIADDPGVVTARGIAVGTPRYMSPEQARGEKVDGRADVYSTGLILFEMLTGVGPFDDARDANDLILAHLVRKPPAVSSLVMGITPELDAAVARMLAKGRDERPATALEAARLLRSVPLEAPVSKPERRNSSLPPPSSTPYDATLVPGEVEHDTTRPDGVASRRSTLTSGSLADGMLHPCPEAQRPLGQLGQPLPDTLISPPSFASNSAMPAGDVRVRTEMLTAIPQAEAAVTRTRFPSASETPPPVTPLPELDDLPLRPASRGRAALVLGLGTLVIASLVGAALLRPVNSSKPDAAAAGPTQPASPLPNSEPARDLSAPHVRAAVPAPAAALAPPAAAGAAAPATVRDSSAKAKASPSSRPSAERNRTRAAAEAKSDAKEAAAPARSQEAAPPAAPKPAPKKADFDALPRSGL